MAEMIPRMRVAPVDEDYWWRSSLIFIDMSYKAKEMNMCLEVYEAKNTNLSSPTRMIDRGSK
jgi:hypothetical protein